MDRDDGVRGGVACGRIHGQPNCRALRGPAFHPAPPTVRDLYIACKWDANPRNVAECAKYIERHHHAYGGLRWSGVRDLGVDAMSNGLAYREAVRLIVEGGGSSRAVTRLHIMIGLSGYRTRDLLCIRRALYRRTEKA
jgi:hypothetical protein